MHLKLSIVEAGELTWMQDLILQLRLSTAVHEICPVFYLLLLPSTTVCVNAFSCSCIATPATSTVTFLNYLCKYIRHKIDQDIVAMQDKMVARSIYQ